MSTVRRLTAILLFVALLLTLLRLLATGPQAPDAKSGDRAPQQESPLAPTILRPRPSASPEGGPTRSSSRPNSNETCVVRGSIVMSSGERPPSLGVIVRAFRAGSTSWIAQTTAVADGSFEIAIAPRELLPPHLTDVTLG